MTVPDTHQGNYNGSPGGMGKDPITNNPLDLIGGAGGARDAAGPGGHQPYSTLSYTANLSNTWEPGGHKGGKGGNGGDYGAAGSTGGDASGHERNFEYGYVDRYYGHAGRGGAAGRAAIYSDNVTVNIKSARPRNVKGAKTKIDPV